MNITERIINAKVECEVDNRKPTKIYLGHKEWQALQKESGRWTTIMDSGIEFSRARFNDMKVYVVNSIEHLNVC